MKLYDIEEEHRRQRRDRAIEAVAAICGLVGALLVASTGTELPWPGMAFLSQHAALGWIAFLASNLAWIGFAAIRRMPWLLVQQLGFTVTSLLGIWNTLGSVLGAA
jgi:hypothetical protein